jgi:membrane-bound ClpP family serine protease
LTVLVWIAALVLVGLAMMVLEVFVPSGGVLGFLSLAAIVSAVVMAFVEQGPWFGTAVLAVTCVAVPVALGFAFRLFPDTPLGRRVLPPPPRPEEVVPDVDRRQKLRGLVGRRGRATSELLPWGTVEIDGEAHDAMSEAGPVEAAAAVDVVGVQAAGLVVRPAAPAVPMAPVTTVETSPAAGQTQAAPSVAGRRLEEVLEAFDFGALDADATKPGPPDVLDSRRTPNES